MCKRNVLSILICFISIACYCQIDSQFEKKALKGNAKAQYELARSFMRYKDTIQALRWYKESAKQGYHQACFDLAMFYDKVKDYKEAAVWCEKTTGGYPWVLLGKYYKNGIGVEKDYNKAAYWYNRYLQANKPTKKSDCWSSSIRDEMFRLAECYDSLRNYSDATQWYKAILYEKYDTYEERNIVAELRAAAGMHRICYLGLDGNKTSEKYFSEFLKRGGNASFTLEFIANDNEMSKYWLEYAVTFGQVKAYYIMGLAREYGLYGIEKNIKDAYDWYLKAAKQNYYDAYLDVAIMSEKGVGTSRNEEYACKLYEWILGNLKSYVDKSTYYRAMGHLGIMYYYGRSVSRDSQKAFTYLSESWRQCNDSDVLWTLSNCYRYGQGTDIDNKMADVLKKLAEIYGNENAIMIKKRIESLKMSINQ